MKFILYISTRLRHGQFPKLPDFQFSNEHGKYIYRGRELTGEELNAACDVVFSEKYYNKGFQFRPLVIFPPAVPEVSTVETPEPPAPPPNPATFPTAPLDPPADSSPEQTTPTEFTLTGRDILLDGVKIAALSAADGTLRVPTSRKHLRPAIEAWLASQP